MRQNFPAPQRLRPKCLHSKFLSRIQCASMNVQANLLTELVEPRLVFRRNRIIFNHCPKKESQVLYLVLQIACHAVSSHVPGVLDVSQIAVAFHKISPPFFIQARLQQYSRRSFFYSAYRSFSNAICLGSSVEVR